MIRRLITTLGVTLVAFSLQLPAHETIRLRSGYSFDADSHREEQGVVFINVGSGSVQIAKGDIEEIQILAEERQSNAATKSSVAAESAEEVLRRAARAQGVDEAFVRSVAKIESGMKQNAVSAKGARGLMQLMPGTAALMSVDSLEASGNALGGAMYLRQLLLRFKGDSALALAAYNAGPGAVAKYGGIPPYAETRNYILRVLAEYRNQVRIASTKAGGVHKSGTTN